MENLSKSYKEMNIILNLLGNEYVDKIPSTMKSFFIKHQDSTYNPNISLKDVVNHNILPETTSIMTALYIKYWTKDNTEKEKYMSMIRKYDEEQKEKLYNVFGTNSKK